MWTCCLLLTLQWQWVGARETIPPESKAQDYWVIIRVPDKASNGSMLHKPTCGPELHYISVYVQKEKIEKQWVDKKPLPKVYKAGITIHFKNNTHSFWPGAL